MKEKTIEDKKRKIKHKEHSRKTERCAFKLQHIVKK